MAEYYVWRSDERQVGTTYGSDCESAAHRYALKERLPYNVAVRIVLVSDVESFGLGVYQYRKPHD